jgi:hypothetical protein
MAYNQFCLRICISENSTYSASIQCQHTLDLMGCQFVMPGDYTDNSFTECDGDSAYPPGVYPLGNGQYSTFAQRYTGTYTQGGSIGMFTVGQTVTPASAASVPATSNCKTYTSIGNGIASLAAGVTSKAASGSASTTSGSASATGSASMSGASGASGASAASGIKASGQSAVSGAAAGASSAKSSGAAMSGYAGANYGSALGAGLSVLAVVAGAGAILL